MLRTCEPWAPRRRRRGAHLGAERSIGGVTHPDRPLMTRIVRSIGFVVALATASLGLGVLALTSGGQASAQGGGFTPLPPGWELCVLQGLGAPATANNVADLDEWQAAEGGSTNNTAAFNPYNTLRTTDNTGAAIPGAVTSANGFPAFPSMGRGMCGDRGDPLPAEHVGDQRSTPGGQRLPPGGIPGGRRPERMVRAVACRVAVLRQRHGGQPGQPRTGRSQLVCAGRLREREHRPAVVPEVHHHGHGRPGHGGRAVSGPGCHRDPGVERPATNSAPPLAPCRDSPSASTSTAGCTRALHW